MNYTEFISDTKLNMLFAPYLYYRVLRKLVIIPKVLYWAPGGHHVHI